MPHSKINVANLQLQQALKEITDISRIILDGGIFNKERDRKSIEYMQLLQKRAIEYQDELLRHNNLINIELFNNINEFLQEHAEMVKQNAVFFNDLLEHPNTYLIAHQLLPRLKYLVDYATHAIYRFADLKQATSSQLSGEHQSSKEHNRHAHRANRLSGDDPEILGSMSANVENVLTNLLKHLPEIIGAYQNFMNVLNSVLGAIHQESSKSSQDQVLHQHHAHKEHTKKAKKRRQHQADQAEDEDQPESRHRHGGDVSGSKRRRH